MRNGLLILILLIITAGCRSKNKIPRDVLPQKKMQAILWDMMRVDQFLADYVLNKDSSKNKTTESLQYYQQVFAIHKISKEEFQRSFSYYKSHPVLLKAVMDSISASPKDTVQPAVMTKPVFDTGVAKADIIVSKIDKVLPLPDLSRRDSLRARKVKKPLKAD
ncbi:MAG: DUF4296 domain-containing protein [Bacteroidota bacterium]|nr:DUF4296 domain-containing protein [Bacteroidota bacterium]